MLKIFLPDNHHAERKYIAEIIFDEFLGLSFQLIFKKTLYSLEIHLQNGNILFFEDHFFNQFIPPLNYLSINNIPAKISIATKSDNPFINDADLPIIFGKKSVNINSDIIICKADISACVFFMLSRWEEYVNKNRDEHFRFPAASSLAQKKGFLQRPVVDEYVEMLWNMLSFLKINQKRKKRSFKAVITHDVDLPLYWKSPYSLLKKTGKDLLKSNSIRKCTNTLKDFIQVKSNSKADPYDTFEYIMDISENNNLKSYFFFLTSGETKFDKGHLPHNHKFIKKLTRRINERGHIIGFHPSYNTHNNEKLFSHELEKLKEISPQKIEFGRQHFLRFSIPKTWEIWDNSNLKWESSMYYAETGGFRCGTCHMFSVFDIIKKKKLKLKELPLLAMEVTWTNYLKSTPNEMKNDLSNLIEICRRYDGNFVFLWHNSSYNLQEWKPYKKVYEEILSTI